MRSFLPVAAAALMLCACQPAAPAAGTAPVAAANTVALCMEPIRKEVAFSSPTAKDVFEVTAIGTDCKESSILATIRSASGELLWSRAETPVATMVFADADQSTETPAQQLRKGIEASLGDFVVRSSSEAPEWKEGAARPEEPSGLFVGTDFDRERYNLVKTEKHQMLCHMVFNLRTQCLVYFDGGGGPNYAEQLYDLQS